MRRQLTPREVREQLAFHVEGDAVGPIVDDIVRTSALVDGHFALHDGKHTPYAVRFRVLARDHAALERLARAALRQAAQWSWTNVTIVSPESAGFLLGHQVHVETGRPQAIVQTDLRRRPTRQLMTGALQGGSAVVVNDVFVTGDSLETMSGLVKERHAKLEGVIVFVAVDPGTFVSACNALGAAPAYVASARWIASDPDDCEGCRAGDPLIPIAEFA